MKLFKSAALIGIGKKLYNESRKPQNRAKIQRAVDSAKNRRRKPQR